MWSALREFEIENSVRRVYITRAAAKGREAVHKYVSAEIRLVSPTAVQPSSPRMHACQTAAIHRPHHREGQLRERWGNNKIEGAILRPPPGRQRLLSHPLYRSAPAIAVSTNKPVAPLGCYSCWRSGSSLVSLSVPAAEMWKLQTRSASYHRTLDLPWGERSAREHACATSTMYKW